MISKDDIREAYCSECFKCKHSEIAEPFRLVCLRTGNPARMRCYKFEEYRECKDCRYYSHDGFNSRCDSPNRGCLRYIRGERFAQFFEPRKDDSQTRICETCKHYRWFGEYAMMVCEKHGTVEPLGVCKDYEQKGGEE